MENFETIRNELKYYIRNYAEEMLTKSKSKNQYECVFCGSGTGSHATGALTIYENYFKCYSCGTVGDIFDLCEKVENISKKQVVQHLSAKYQGIQPKRDQTTTESTKTEKRKEVDYTEYYRECNRHLQDTDYHRGISLDTLNKFMIGYDAHWTPPDIPNAPATPRIIVPTSSTSYFARDTRNTDDIPDYQQKYIKQKQGDMHIFNENALKQISSPVFVVEGEFDALSVIDVGGQAVGLGSTSNTLLFFSVLDDLKLEKYPLFIVSCDNDTAGQKANKELQEGFTERNISFLTLNVCGNCKDQNEALMLNRAEFEKAVQKAIATAKNKQPKEEQGEQMKQEEQVQTELEKYQEQYCTQSHLQDFFNGVNESVNVKEIATGYPILDDILDGGLTEQFVEIGAISSLGKTTYILQMADQIAAAGQDVIIFSLEMARKELIAKSISRLTVQLALSQNLEITNAKTAMDILKGRKYKTYTKTERELINTAVQQYSEIAKYSYIIESSGVITVDKIKEDTEKHIKLTGRKPVVIVDYLQILAPHNPNATDKANTDYAVLTLKHLSRDFGIPVIAISSFNRTNYTKTVNMSSFKESGSIEYSADILIGMQLQGVGDKDKKITEAKAKAKHPRDVQVVILKNRNGELGDIYYKYYSKYNYFKEIKKISQNEIDITDE